MPMAVPRSINSQMSAIVPAPMACTEDAALWLNTRVVISMLMGLDTAVKMTKKLNEKM